MKIIKFLDLLLLLLLFWFLLTLNFNVLNIILGIIVSLVITFISYPIIYRDTIYLKRIKILPLIIYLFKLIFNIYKSSIFYIISMFSNNYHPILIEIEVNIKNPFIISIIANSITLTPGTITVDYKNKILSVLTYSHSNQTKEQIKENIINQYIKPFEDKEK